MPYHYHYQGKLAGSHYGGVQWQQQSAFNTMAGTARPPGTQRRTGRQPVLLQFLRITTTATAQDGNTIAGYPRGI